MDIYRNSFHTDHLYLRLEDPDAETLQPSHFKALLKTYGIPLQSMVSSDKADLVALLKKTGFVLKRRCFEMHVSSSDLLSPLPAPVRSIRLTTKGTQAYADCASLMYDCYRDAHLPVNPLTASLSEFIDILPETAAFFASSEGCESAAFLEENEIAYLCSRSKAAFPAFACSLLCYMFQKFGSVVFEADDTDWAAIALKRMFSAQNDLSFDTYVLESRQGIC